MKQLRAYFVIVLIIVLLYVVLAQWLQQKAVAEHERLFNEQQAMQTRLTARSIEDHFGWILAETNLVVDYAIPLVVTEPRYSVEWLLPLASQTIEDEQLAYGFFLTPEVPVLIRRDDSPAGLLAEGLVDEWIAAYWDDALASDLYVTPFQATADYQVYGVLRPAYVAGEFYGMYITVLDFGPVLEQYVVPMRSGNYGAAWVQDATSYVIYDHEPETIGQLVDDVSASYPDLQRINRRIKAEEQGQGEYHYTVELGGDVQRKLVAWHTAHLGNQRLSVAMSAPDSEINASLTAYRQQTGLLGALLGLTLIASGGLVYFQRQRSLQRLVDARTQELQDLNRDLEARVEARTAELNRERAQLKAILDAMGDGLVYRDAESIKYTNRALCDLLGYAPDDLTGTTQSFFTRLTGSPAGYLPPRTDADSVPGWDSVWRAEVELRRKDGTMLNAGLTSALVCDQDGGRLGNVDVIRDISQEKALQEQKDRFIAHAAHELRTPLSNLKTRLYLLQRQPEKVDAHSTVMQQVTDSMTQLVNDLLEVTRFQQGSAVLRRQPTDLRGALQAVLERRKALATRAGVALESELGTEPVVVLGDAQRLGQVFNSLVENAIHHVKADGTVTVRLATQRQQGRSYARVQVIDDGPPIDDALLAQVFDPFFRVSDGHSPGTGLGLTIARAVITQHGGELTVESDAERGMIFSVLLDLDARH